MLEVRVYLIKLFERFLKGVRSIAGTPESVPRSAYCVIFSLTTRKLPFYENYLTAGV